MNNFNSLRSKIYEVNDGSFADIAVDLFKYQATRNNLYAAFLGYLQIDPVTIKSVDEIPFMPLSFFKRHAIQTGSWNPQTIFTSSGTTGSVLSQHLVYDTDFYLENCRRCFELFFGPLKNFHFLALLPSYLERQGSSLIYMIDFFIRESGSPHSGFYLHNSEALVRKAESLRNDPRKVIIWGVTFALLDLAEQFPHDLSHCLIMETGGMKGRRKELTRAEFYGILRKGLNATGIHSEYGMTELLSQAYTTYTSGEFRFKAPPFMRILGRDMSDPMQKSVFEETAGINIVDLANFHSIAFLETEDLGKIYADGSFEVLGRMDNSDIRGCNLMV